MLLKIIRWIFGYIIFSLDQKDSKSFLNLVSRLKFCIWDINKFDNKLFAKITSSEYKKLDLLLKRNNIKLHSVKRTGLPFFYLRYKNRKGILVGLILFFLFLHFLLLFIWKINIIGSDIVDKNLVLKIAKNNNIFVGSIKKNIDAKSAGQNIMSGVPNISWISINLDGCVANINIKDQVNKLESEMSKEGNIVSECDARIVRMETFSGTPLVHVGDVVLKDQLLVGAYEKLKDGNIKNVYAKANILAKVIDEVEEFETFNQNLEEYTGKEKKIFKINLFGKYLNLNFWQNEEKDWKKELYENKLNLFGLEIPVEFITEKFLETKIVSKVLSKEEAIEKVKNKAYEKINKDLEILKYEDSYSEKENGINFKVKFEYLKDISSYKK